MTRERRRHKARSKCSMMNRLLDAAEAQGWEVAMNPRTSYIKCRTPDGAKIVLVPCSPVRGENSRAYLNKRAQFRRAGLTV